MIPFQPGVGEGTSRTDRTRAGNGILARLSRSIHQTRRDLAKERRWRHPHDELRAKRLADIRHALRKKRALKRKSAELRKSEERPLQAPPRPPDTIPIRVSDAGPCVHHHASPDDVRAILRALPEGTLTGVEAVELCLGKEACEEFVDRDGDREAHEPDPFTARLGNEVVPGLHVGPLLGQYQRQSGRVWIFAYVHEPPGAGRAHPPGFALTLRLRQLATLVHELAHHDDAMLRTGRTAEASTESRFEKGESFALRKEREWVREIVVPYLDRAYADAVRAWERWMEATVGIPFTLRTLADVLYGGIGWSDAYLDLLGNVLSGRDALETRIAFADELHYNHFFELSLAVTRAALAQHPEALEARALEADVLEHLGRLDEAQASVDAVLRRAASHARTWHVQMLLLTKRRAWRELAEAAQRARREAQDGSPHAFAGHEALAHVHLGDAQALVPCLAALRARGNGYDLGQAAWLEHLMELRLGRFEELLSLASAAPGGRTWRERVEACRTLALLRLGRGPEGIRVRDEVLSVLRYEGFLEWADELARARSGGGRSS